MTHGKPLTRRSFLQTASAVGFAANRVQANDVRLLVNSEGGYRFRKGGAQLSSGGVVAMTGYEIVHVTFAERRPLTVGFEAIDTYLEMQHRPLAALCAIELRCPRPFAPGEFAKFNEYYVGLLANRKLLIDGVNPVARVNLAPATDSPAEVSIYGFSYAAPQAAARPTFVLAASDQVGAYPDGIVARGDVSINGLRQKLVQVLANLERWMQELNVGWQNATSVALYTVHDIGPLMSETLLPRIGNAGRYGLQWYYAHPPVPEVELEIGVRGSSRELVI